jgi:hypothetical protein
VTDSLEGFLRGGLEREGVAVSDEDLQLMRMADAVYGPALRGLMDADLGGEDAELGLDPAGPPA